MFAVRTLGRQFKIVGCAVERVVVAVMDYLLWPEWATEKFCHNGTVLKLPAIARLFVITYLDRPVPDIAEAPFPPSPDGQGSPAIHPKVCSAETLGSQLWISHLAKAVRALAWMPPGSRGIALSRDRLAADTTRFMLKPCSHVGSVA